MQAFFVLVFFPFFSHASDKIVVTATRSESAEVPFSIDRLDGDSWSRTGGNPEQYFGTIPGLSFSVSGAAGQTRSVLIRGAKAEHTLVLIDGIPANDPLSPARAFDFGQLPLSEVERIEILKGPQSVLYGSDAMGGVVQLLSKKDGAARARLEAGSYDSLNASVSAMGFRAGYFETKGFSAADAREGNSEKDGSQAWNLGGSKDFPLNNSILMRLNAQYQNSKTDTDRSGGLHGDSRNTYATHSQFFLREENVILIPEDAEISLSGSYSNHDREDNTNGNDYYKANQWKVETIGRQKNIGPHSLTLGAEYAEERGRSSQIVGGDHRFREGAIYLQDELTFERAQMVAGGRIDLHNVSENAATTRLGLAYWLIPKALRTRGSLGTGFKAPSLYQTYSNYGSNTLRPERSIGFEIGLDFTLEDWSSEFTAFSNRFRDLVDFDAINSRYFNQSRAETYGAEWSLRRRFGRFQAENAFTILRALDPGTGLRLLRRPLFSDSVSLSIGREKKYGAAITARIVGEREDIHPQLYTRQTMPAFFTFGTNFFRSIGEGLRITARGENLLDRRYQETSGFGTAGLSGYLGLEADL